ncbi:M23 family metallopeptidase [Viridibacillus sp. YIM B01967]|uniref:M23 family metallopeptidase n=2 Tax=Viridibacillus soli TaxID=2798301 RepID=A0ABS1HAL5_9BACL|nr:M23 family metallopeptidase [Viridibacillus soli]MBK3496478.1 M23 family metallopeptidase [Viridibacillus soli]
MLYLSTLFFLFSAVVSAAEEPSREQILEKRMEYYVNYSNNALPWYYLAAVDQYERNIQQVRSDIPKRESVVAIQFSDDYWTGALNPIKDDTNLTSIAFFGGNGSDGNHDGKADLQNDDDVMFTMAEYLSEFGPDEKDFKRALKEYYQADKTIDQIIANAKIYKKFGTLNLDERAFVLSIKHDYSYRSTWGDSRGWGGRRIHEGTDLFASYGVPVKSATYGLVEIMGWNDFGGWRMGIRDNNNTYHYYAHLSSFEKGVKVGDVIEPGTVIGYVGSSGYGKKGTSGKFPPHLHYGMYKYNGKNEWAFDPFPSLKIWEKVEKSTKKI